MVDRDYSDFLNLSVNLHGLERKVTEVSSGLVQYRDTIAIARAKLEEMVCSLQADLTRKRLLLEKRRLCERMIDCYALVDTAGRSEDVGDQLEESRALAKFQAISTPIPASKGLDALRERARRLRQQLIDSCETIVHQSFSSNAKVPAPATQIQRLQSTLIVLHNLGETELLRRGMAERIVSQLFAPFLRKEYLIEQGHEAAFAQLLRSLHDGLRSRVDAVQNGLAEIDLAAEVVLPAALSVLVDNGECYFSTSDPEQFTQAYTAGVKFISRLEATWLENQSARVELFCLSAERGRYTEKWNIPVYFQLRYQDIISAFEPVLKQSPQRDANAEFNLLQTAVLWRSIEKCWPIDGVGLVQLFPRFWKLTMQLIARITIWLGLLNADQLPFEMLTLLLCDVDSIERRLRLLLPETIGKRMNLNAQCLALSQESLDIALQRLRMQSLRIRSACSQVGALQLTHVLKGVTEIPRLYRKTNRELSQQCSTFMDKFIAMLGSLSDYHHSNADDRIGDGSFVNELLTSVVDSFSRTVTDLLDKVRKTEETMKRFQKLRPGVTDATMPANGAMTDEDKIRTQVFTDLEALSHHLSSAFDFDTHAVPSFASARHTLLGEFGVLPSSSPVNGC